jgi:chromosome segregation ATPase
MRNGSTDDDLNLIKMELDRQSTTELAPSQLAHQIESIASASRSIETALMRERNYSKQLREYAQQIITKLHFLQRQEKEATDRLREIQSHRDENARQVKELSAELQKSQQELLRFRNAWSQIQAREKHAQYVLSQGETSAKRIQELEIALSALEKRLQVEKSSREKAEGHVATQRQELQTALVRLHSSEARYNDMARELEAIHTLRKNHALELSRVEQMVREKLEAQVVRERELMQHELAREKERWGQELAQEREKFSKTRTELGFELERLRSDSDSEKERLRRELETKHFAEIQRIKAQAETQLQMERQQSSESLRGEIAKMESIIRSLGDESKSLRNELSQARAEVSSIEQSNRQVELDLLRSREEVSSLQKQIAEERGRRSALEQSYQNSEKARQEAEARREKIARYQQELCDLIQADRRQMQRLIERLIAIWGSEDAALAEALEALRVACEVRTVRTEAPPSKLEIVTTGSSRLNC